MISKLKRIGCHLFGCLQAEFHPGCERCGSASFYDSDYIDRGLTYPIFAKWWWFKSLIRETFRIPRCSECGKRMPWSMRHDWCCSEECYQKNVPF